MPQSLVDDNTTYPSPVSVPLGGEPRTAASVKTPFQTVANRAAYLKRVFDELVGGVTAAAHLKAANITFTGNLVSGAPTAMLDVGQAHLGQVHVYNGLTIDPGTFLHITGGSNLLMDADCPAQFDGTVTSHRLETEELEVAGGVLAISSSAFLMGNGVPIYMSAPLFFTGSGPGAGRIVQKVVAGVAGDHTYSVGDATLVMIPTVPSGTWDYTISEVGAEEGDTMTFSMLADTTFVSAGGVALIRETGGTQIGASLVKAVGGSQPQWMTIVMLSGVWQPALAGKQ